ncbi:MAG: hypothetical protein ACYCW6_12095 [Candidatus Xenobia bacterium]
MLQLSWDFTGLQADTGEATWPVPPRQARVRMPKAPRPFALRGDLLRRWFLLPLVEPEARRTPVSAVPLWVTVMTASMRLSEGAFEVAARIAESGGRIHVEDVGMNAAAVRDARRELGAAVNTPRAFPEIAWDADGETLVMHVEALSERFNTDTRRIRVPAAGGQVISFTLPFEPSDLERRILEALARYGRLTEAELARTAKTRRIGGVMETLLDRLSRGGFHAVAEEAAGDQGRVYVFRQERL